MQQRLCILFFSLLAPFLLFSQNEQDLNSLSGLKKTVCLNMIVKNESGVIKRCLHSVLPFIDTWVIVDTGSNDGTQKIIQDFMDQHELPGELHERPWVDFGHNREEALQLAKHKADYLLFIDADDMLVYSPQFQLPHLIHDVYLVKGRDKEMQFYLWTLVNASLDWHWKDPIHEHLAVDDHPELAGALLDGIEYLYLHDGARSKDPLKGAKDLQALHEALAKNPDNKRLTYHLAQTYANLNNLHQAIAYYQKRIDLGGNPQEVFSAMLYLAKTQERLGCKKETIAATYQKALDFRPSRPEPIYYLARQARLDGDYQKAYAIASRGQDLPPSTDITDLEYAAYDNILLECAYCSLEIGRYKECKRLCAHLKAKPDLNKDQQENVKAISALLKEKLYSIKALKVVNRLYEAVKK